MQNQCSSLDELRTRCRDGWNRTNVFSVPDRVPVPLGYTPMQGGRRDLNPLDSCVHSAWARLFALVHCPLVGNRTHIDRLSSGCTNPLCYERLSSMQTALAPVDFSTCTVSQQTFVGGAQSQRWSAWRESNPQAPGPEPGGLPSSHHADSSGGVNRTPVIRFKAEGPGHWTTPE